MKALFQSGLSKDVTVQRGSLERLQLNTTIIQLVLTCNSRRQGSHATAGADQVDFSKITHWVMNGL